MDSILSYTDQLFTYIDPVFAGWIVSMLILAWLQK